ncbi:MAG: hypothetical protein RBU29_05145 [bacterium]|nr:hypothetical protein [bacterium]
MKVKRYLLLSLLIFCLVPATFAVEIFNDFEDFGQIDQWEELAGLWDIYEGFFTEIDDAGGPIVVATGDPMLTDYVIMVRAMGLVADADWGIAFRIQDINNHYSWQFVNGGLDFIKYVNGTRSQLFHMVYGEQLEVWQDFKVVVKGNTFDLYFNNELMTTVTDSDLPSGRVGLFSWVNEGSDAGNKVGYTAFDNFYVTDREQWVVKRSVPTTPFVPGQTIAGVQLSLDLLYGTLDQMTVTDTIPAGFTATNFQASAGTASFANGVVTWKMNAISTNATLTYDVVTPGSKTAGNFVVDGKATDGKAIVNIAPNTVAMTLPLKEELFFDFEAATQADAWQPLAGEWGIQDGTYRQLADADGPLLAITGDPDASDYTVILQGMGLVTGADWGIVFRAQGVGNFYSWQFVNDTLALIRYVNGTRSSLFSVAEPEVLNVWQEFKVVVQGNRFECYFDGRLITTVTDGALAWGQVGVFAWVNGGSPVAEAGGGVAYDNMHVIKQVPWTVKRVMPTDIYKVGDKVVGIQLTASPLAGTSVGSLTVTETVPAGLTVSNVQTTAGSATASGNTITWTLPGLATNASLTYDLQAPSDKNTGAIQISGSASDGFLTQKTAPSTLYLTLGIPLSQNIFFDFSQAAQESQWEALAGDWGIQDGQFLEFNDDGGPLVAVTGPVDASDYTISVKAMGLMTNADWGVVFRATDIGNFFSWQFVNGTLALIRYVNGTRTTVWSQGFNEILNEWQVYTADVRGNTFDLYLDGELIQTVKDNNLPWGQVGLFVWSAGANPVAFDDFSATAPTAVELWMMY